MGWKYQSNRRSIMWRVEVSHFNINSGGDEQIIIHAKFSLKQVRFFSLCASTDQSKISSPPLEKVRVN